MMTPLPHRGILEIQGKDKKSFLQGLITNDIELVSPENPLYATLLTPEGRFFYDFFITEKKGSFLLDAETERLEGLIKKLSLYKLRSDVSLTLRPDLHVYAIWGKDETLAPGGAYVDPRLSKLGKRLIRKDPPSNYTTSSPEAYDLHRLELGVPEGGKDLIPEKSILLESGLDELNAISWTKGCYMGQELTARTKYRGLVRKRLFPVTIEGDPPFFGEPILKNDVKIGEMRSHNQQHGLALLRIEDLEEGLQLTCGVAKLKPYAPFWMRLEDPS